MHSTQYMLSDDDDDDDDNDDGNDDLGDAGIWGAVDVVIMAGW